MRFEAPIYTNENVLKEAGVSSVDLNQDFEDENPVPEPKKVVVKSKNDLKSMGIEELKKMLDIAISEEEYERAASIRDEIEKRN